MPASKNPQSGFTLIEMLFAVLILAVGLLGLVQLQVTAMKTNSQSTTTVAAAALAQRIVEEIAAMPGDAAMFNGPMASPALWPDSPYTIAGAGTYNVTYNVSAVAPVSGQLVTDFYKITVVVSSSSVVGHVTGPKFRVAEASTVKRAL